MLQLIIKSMFWQLFYFLVRLCKFDGNFRSDVSKRFSKSRWSSQRQTFPFYTAVSMKALFFIVHCNRNSSTPPTFLFQLIGKKGINPNKVPGWQICGDRLIFCSAPEHR